MVYYGGAFLATSILNLSVVPIPRDISIHPLVVTSVRDVTQVITCSAVFPVVSSDVMVRVRWSSAGGNSTVSDEWTNLLPAVVTGMYTNSSSN